jgi:hypothetical protein
LAEDNRVDGATYPEIYDVDKLFDGNVIVPAIVILLKLKFDEVVINGCFPVNDVLMVDIDDVFEAILVVFVAIDDVFEAILVVFVAIDDVFEAILVVFVAIDDVLVDIFEFIVFNNDVKLEPISKYPNVVFDIPFIDEQINAFTVVDAVDDVIVKFPDPSTLKIMPSLFDKIEFI